MEEYGISKLTYSADNEVIYTSYNVDILTGVDNAGHALDLFLMDEFGDLDNIYDVHHFNRISSTVIKECDYAEAVFNVSAYTDNFCFECICSHIKYIAQGFTENNVVCPECGLSDITVAFLKPHKLFCMACLHYFDPVFPDKVKRAII